MCKKCTKCYDDVITGNPEKIKINGNLTPSKEYHVLIKDGFGNTYAQEVTSDDKGSIEIDSEGLPDGFFTKGNRGFEVRVFEDEQYCNPVEFVIPMKYECIRITPGSCEGSKDEVGCSGSNSGGGGNFWFS